MKGAFWVRAGWFVPSMESFVDAFDHTVYSKQVWYYEKPGIEDRKEAPRDRQYGVELHVLPGGIEVEKISRAVQVTTVGELCHCLTAAGESALLLARDDNFELGGSLTAGACLWLYQDAEQSCLVMNQ